MPTFRFEGVTPQGKKAQGSIQAESRDEAMRRLSDGGVMVQILADTVAPVVPLVQAIVRRPWADSILSHKDLSLFFAQFSATIKAGMGAAQALTHLSQSVRNRALAQACRSMVHEVSTGQRISEAMGRFPKLFPEYVIGTIRAGEAAGYLPDAMTEIADYNDRWHRLRIWYWIPKLALWNAVLIAPLIVISTKVFLDGFAAYGEDESLGVSGALGKAFKPLFWKFIMPLWAAVLFAWAVWSFALRSALEPLRARAALGLPIIFGYGRYTLANSLRAFLNHLERLYEAGLAPSTAWDLAAGAVPNQYVASRLRAIQTGDRNLNVAEAARQTGLFSEDLIGVLNTGVSTGDVPGMIGRLARFYEEEAQNQYTMTRPGVVRLGLLIFLVSTGIGMIGFANNYFNRIFEAVEEFMGTR